MAALLWWNVAFDEPPPVFIETTTGVSQQAILSSHPGAYAIAGPWLVESDATAWLNQHAKPAFGGHGNWPPAPPKKTPSGGGGGTPAPNPPPGGSPPPKVPSPGKLATFGAWKNWIDSRAPGQGDVWIAWVESHAKITPPQSDTVDLNSSVFPAGSTGLLGGSNNHASNWFAAWILLGNVGPDIAKLLAGAIGGVGKKIPGVLQDTGEGIGQVPGAKALGGLDAIGNFFSTLGDRATWVRIIKVVVGSIMIIAGLVKLGAPGAEQIAGKLPKVIPV